MPKKLRPVPEGFRDIFRDVPLEALARHYKTSCDIVRRWIDECGGREKLSSANALRPCPDDFAEMYRKLPVSTLKKHYQAAARTIERWRRECNLPTNRISNCRPMPYDFYGVAPRMFIKELMDHYKAGRPAVHRWLLEAGVQPRQEDKTPRIKLMNQARAPSAGYKNHYGNLTQTKASSIYDDAANVIRAKCPVFRCNDKGKYDAKGEFWRVGWSILTGDELLERADRYRSRAA